MHHSHCHPSTHLLHLIPSSTLHLIFASFHTRQQLMQHDYGDESLQIFHKLLMDSCNAALRHETHDRQPSIGTRPMLSMLPLQRPAGAEAGAVADAILVASACSLTLGKLTLGQQAPHPLCLTTCVMSHIYTYTYIYIHPVSHHFRRLQFLLSWLAIHTLSLPNWSCLLGPCPPCHPLTFPSPALRHFVMFFAD